MRIIWILSSVAAAVASGPAPGQSFATMGPQRGPAHPGPGSRSGRIVATMGPAFRHDPIRRPGRHDGRRDGRHRFDRGGEGFLYSYGFAEPFEPVDPHGNGFFAGVGGGIDLRGGRPYYDYDRSYPYEWASAAASRPTRWAPHEESLPPATTCGLERGVRVCRGRR